MLTYPKDYEDSKIQLKTKLEELISEGYQINASNYKITEDLSIDKVIIKSKEKTSNRLILDTGLHGIEGFVGHACVMVFLDEILKTLRKNTEVIIYHTLNPFGMKNYRRNNENNVDLNRNFSSNHFSSNNPGFDQATSFFRPKKYSGIKRSNIAYYYNVIKLILKYGVSTLKEATLLGQKTAHDAIYYSGIEYQSPTNYILKEMQTNFIDINQVVWIDLHTGYGPRYEMSIVNSKQEKENNLEMSSNINYPRVLGLNPQDFYDIDGDMIEMMYYLNEKKERPIQLYGTCFEFGTFGDSLLNSLKSLKAMIFENSSYFISQKTNMNTYIKNLIKEQFMPSESKWKQKAYMDFKLAISGIIQYKKL